MLFPTLQGHLGAGHVNLIMQWPLPLYACALLRLRQHVSVRAIALTAFLFFLAAAGHPLQVIYTLLPFTVVYGLVLLSRRDWPTLRRAVIAAGIGLLAVALFQLPTASATLSTAAYTGKSGTVRYSADLLSVVSPSFLNPLF